jgi:DNA invertase Pin-like site-specific DNA recombinase
LYRKAKEAAVAYLRTSSAANVGSDRDSEKRQRDAICAFARRASLNVVEEFYDAAVSGSDPIEDRPGFCSLLSRIEGNGIRTVVVEDATRFARDLITQELGIIALIKRRVRVLTASGDDLTQTSDPFKIAMRQIAGAFAQLEKTRLVAKLRAARERKRASGEKVEGRKSYGELKPKLVKEAKRLARKPTKGSRLSLRQISAALAAKGFLTPSGKAYAAAAISKMIATQQNGLPRPRRSKII